MNTRDFLVVGLIMAMLVAVSSLLPWANGIAPAVPRFITPGGSAPSFRDMVSIPGTDGDGKITLITSLVVGARIVWELLTQRESRSNTMLMVVGGAIIVLVAWINMTDVGRRAADVQTQTKLVQVSVGGGLWLTLIGGVGLGLTGLAIGNLQRVEAQTKTASSVSSQEPMPKPEPPNLERQQDAPQSHSPAEEVARFAKLRDQGVLTPEEFEAKKKQLLGL